MVTPDEAGNWNYVFKNLTQYDAKGKITYTVTESAVAGYETSVSGYNITNTHKPATLDITGTKTWNDSNNQDGKRPKSITVNLLANVFKSNCINSIITFLDRLAYLQFSVSCICYSYFNSILSSIISNFGILSLNFLYC